MNWVPLQGVSGCYLTINPAMILKGSKLSVGEGERFRGPIRQVPAIPEKSESAALVDRVRDLLQRVDAFQVSDATEREATLARIAEHEREAAERARRAKEEEEQRKRAEEKAQMERDRREIERRQAEILRQNQLRKQQEERAAAARLKLQQQKAEEEKQRLAEEQAEFERQRAENLKRQAEILRQSELRKQQEERIAAARLKLQQQKDEEEKRVAAARLKLQQQQEEEERRRRAEEEEETRRKQAEILRQNELRRQQEAEFAAAFRLRQQQEEEERARLANQAEAKRRAVAEAMRRAGADPVYYPSYNQQPQQYGSQYMPSPAPQPAQPQVSPVDQAIDAFASNRSLFEPGHSNARSLLEKMIKERIDQESAVAAAEEFSQENNMMTYSNALAFARAYSRLVEQARRWPSVQRSMFRRPLRLFNNDVNVAEQYLLTMNDCSTTYPFLTFEDIAFLLDLTGPNGSGAGGIKPAAETFSNLKEMGFPLDRIKWAIKQRGPAQALDALCM